ncbi:MAG: NRDE family protein [Vicinamibacterales bacterium]
MCTVTVVPTVGGFRLACNRDERFTRPTALPPARHQLGSRQALFPVDPVGPGTWIGVNDRGMAAALLNRTDNEDLRPARQAFRSRGLIVPAILSCGSLEEVDALLRVFDPRDCAPFRVLIAHNGAAVLWMSDGDYLARSPMTLASPTLLTSSSLGDDRVDGPRRTLFEQIFSSSRDQWPRGQWEFHAHQWPASPEISVRMRRSDACTVSLTMIEAGRQFSTLRYHRVGARHTVVREI